ncbi:hypothetical protein BDZ89DRAFT_1036936 [Hymenopellis radicata]|nr:hypothetical protein BDZ89DRAFT_1036936 [Hymenopellis radicata]
MAGMLSKVAMKRTLETDMVQGNYTAKWYIALADLREGGGRRSKGNVVSIRQDRLHRGRVPYVLEQEVEGADGGGRGSRGMAALWVMGYGLWVSSACLPQKWGLLLVVECMQASPECTSSRVSSAGNWNPAWKWPVAARAGVAFYYPIHNTLLAQPTASMSSTSPITLSSSYPSTINASPKGILPLARHIVADYLESPENRHLVINQEDYCALVGFLEGDRDSLQHLQHAFSSLYPKAYFRNGDVFVGKARLVPVKDLAQVLATLPYRHNVAHMVLDVADRFVGVPESLVRVWHVHLSQYHNDKENVPPGNVTTSHPTSAFASHLDKAPPTITPSCLTRRTNAQWNRRRPVRLPVSRPVCRFALNCLPSQSGIFLDVPKTRLVVPQEKLPAVLDSLPFNDSEYQMVSLSQKSYCGLPEALVREYHARLSLFYQLDNEKKSDLAPMSVPDQEARAAEDRHLDEREHAFNDADVIHSPEHIPVSLAILDHRSAALSPVLPTSLPPRTGLDQQTENTVQHDVPDHFTTSNDTSATVDDNPLSGTAVSDVDPNPAPSSVTNYADLESRTPAAGTRRVIRKREEEREDSTVSAARASGSQDPQGSTRSVQVEGAGRKRAREEVAEESEGDDGQDARRRKRRRLNDVLSWMWRAVSWPFHYFRQRHT